MRVVILIISMVAAVGTGASSVWAATLAATVNGQPLLRWEAERELASLVSTGSFHTNIAPEQRSELERQTVEALVLKELKRQWAEQTGVDVDPSVVDASFAEVRARFPNDKTFAAALNDKGISDAAAFRRAFKRDAAADAADRHILSQVSRPGADEVEVYFILHRDEFVRPEARHIVHVLFPVSPGADQERWGQTKERAEMLVFQVTEGSQPFLESAAATIEQTPPRYRDQVGDLGFVHRGTLHPELDLAVFSTDQGEVTSPVRTIYGYHVVQVLEIQPPEPLEFDQVREAIATTLFDQRRAEALAAFERTQRGAAEIEVHGWHEEQQR